MLKVRGLKKRFGDLQVLKGIDLDVHEGDVISILGPSRWQRQREDDLPALPGISRTGG